MEGMNPSPESPIQLPLASGEAGTPFSHEIIQLTRQAAIHLKREAGYWKARHDRPLVRGAGRGHELKVRLGQLLAHNAGPEQKLEHGRAKNRGLKQRPHGKRSEKAAFTLGHGRFRRHRNRGAWPCPRDQTPAPSQGLPMSGGAGPGYGPACPALDSARHPGGFGVG